MLDYLIWPQNWWLGCSTLPLFASYWPSCLNTKYWPWQRATRMSNGLRDIHLEAVEHRQNRQAGCKTPNATGNERQHFPHGLDHFNLFLDTYPRRWQKVRCLAIFYYFFPWPCRVMTICRECPPPHPPWSRCSKTEDGYPVRKLRKKITTSDTKSDISYHSDKVLATFQVQDVHFELVHSNWHPWDYSWRVLAACHEAIVRTIEKWVDTIMTQENGFGST